MSNMRSLINLVEAGAGASRIVQSIRSGKLFIAISAFRADKSRKENLRNTKILKNHISRMPVTYVVTNGEYQEIGQDAPSTEVSFFITPTGGMSFQHLEMWGKTLCKAFDQDSFLIGDGQTVWLEDQTGDKTDIGDRVSFAPNVLKTAPASSTVKGKAFTYTDDSNPHAAKATVYGSGKDVE